MLHHSVQPFAHSEVKLRFTETVPVQGGCIISNLLETLYDIATLKTMMWRRGKAHTRKKKVIYNLTDSYKLEYIHV